MTINLLKKDGDRINENDNDRMRSLLTRKREKDDDCVKPILPLLFKLRIKSPSCRTGGDDDQSRL